MTCSGVPLAALQSIAERVGVNLSNAAEKVTKRGVSCRFVLRPIGESLRRVSDLYHDKPRRVNAVCYHGHCQFFDLLFQEHPQAVVVSSVATYRGASDYAAKRDAADVWEGNDFWGRVRTSTQCRCSTPRPTLGEDSGEVTRA